MKNYLDVQGKNAIVTGASSGLGRQFALCLAEQGANVAIAARRVERLEELKKEIQNYVKKRTAPYKYPRIVVFRDELPKTISGKIRRVEIREKDNKK